MDIKSSVEEWLRRRPRDSFLLVAAREIDGVLRTALWTRGSRSGPPPPWFKRRVLRRYANDYGCEILVETGTYKGDTVAAFQRRFRRIVSVELADSLYRLSRDRFRGSAHIEILHGDSGDLLRGITDTLSGRTIYWLDGHYSGGETARTDVDSPVVQELAVLLEDGRPNPILVDDARCFDGKNGYPTLDELSEMVHMTRPSWNVWSKDDIIRITPPE